MPEIEVNGARLHYQERGSGTETLVFSHGLLFSGAMFEAQLAAFESRYRCITFDFRGQGGSEVTADGYDMDTLSEDAAALIQALDAAPCHFVGLSMGGFVGQRLAIRRPELLRSLTLLETSADPEPRQNIGPYRRLNFVARWFGLRWVAGRVMPIMFGRTFLSDPARADERARWRAAMVSNHRVGISRAVRGVIDREGVYDDLPKIEVPTLILVGDQDVATVPAKSERMHEQIAGSKLVTIPEAGHTSTVEQPEAVNRALRGFLDGLA